MSEKHATQNSNGVKDFSSNHQNAIQKSAPANDLTSNLHRAQTSQITESHAEYSRNQDAVPRSESSVQAPNNSAISNSTQLGDTQQIFETQNSNIKNNGGTAKDPPPQVSSADSRLRILFFTTPEKNKQSGVLPDATLQREK